MSTVEEAIDYLLAAAAKKKTPIEILANERKTTKVSVQNQKIEQFAFSETRQVGVRVIDGTSEGLAYSESLEPASLEQMLTEAISNSKAIKKDVACSLHGAKSTPQLAGIFNSQLEAVAAEDKIRQAMKIESAALEHDQRITNVAWAIYNDIWFRKTIANSSGLRASYKANSCSAGVMCLAKDGDATVSDGEFSMARDFSRLHAEETAREAARKTVSRLGARRPPTGKYTVVIENRTAEHLVEMLGSYFSGKSVAEGTSPLKGKLGTTIFSPRFTLTDDPFHAEALSSRPFDDEGYEGKKINLVENGKLTHFLTNSVLAKRLNLPHTAHASRAPSTDLDVAPSNLIVAPGTKTKAQLLAADTTTILITNILGTAGFRYASGDFSLPVEGFLYENGKPIYALKDFLISGNLLQLFNAVEDVGNDVLMPLGAVICPSLLIRDLNVAGQS